MSDEEKKVEETKETVEETKDAPVTEDKPAETKEASKEETKNETPAQDKAGDEKEEEQTAPPSEEVTAAAEEAATPKADETIPETVEGEAEEVELPNRDIKTGMWVRVHEKIKDVNARGEEKERIQVFEGLVIGVKGSQISRTITVRKNANGWMVEKIFPLASPKIEKIEVVKQYRTRRAKMSFLRGRFRRKLQEMK